YVSYGCTYKTDCLTRVAIIPVGYSDGYQLRFSNKTSIMINGCLAPIIGRIGMNMTMIDVTNCNASINDEVTLIGNDATMQATNLIKDTDIFNVREFLTGINPTIKRIII